MWQNFIIFCGITSRRVALQRFQSHTNLDLDEPGGNLTKEIWNDKERITVNRMKHQCLNFFQKPTGIFYARHSPSFPITCTFTKFAADKKQKRQLQQVIITIMEVFPSQIQSIPFVSLKSKACRYFFLGSHCWKRACSPLDWFPAANWQQLQLLI